MTKRVAIINYGLGNVSSVSNALFNLDIDNTITYDTHEIRNATHIILPGVGAFSQGMYNLEDSRLARVLKEEIKAGKPLLGICLGMQMLYQKGYENGQTAGLSLIKGEIQPFKNIPYKIPHVGWNQVNVIKDNKLLKGINDLNFYFVHSYYAISKDGAIGKTDYGITFTSIIEKDNVFGVQFHPEKSGNSGLQLLKNFCEVGNDCFSVYRSS